MDFCQLLHKAQENGKPGSSGVRCYSTKYEPPKKERKSKELSQNIKKFLQKKEHEEQQKQQEARKKKEELLALRAQDKKAVKRVNVMLKRTKSANQSVIQDAVDNNNTAFTLGGPSQPDEDDYGYVSQEASDLYNKMMEKYSQMPEEEPKFNVLKKKVSTNLSNTKERVRAALEKEREEASMPHRRKRKRKESSGGDEDEDGNEEKEEKERKSDREQPQFVKPEPPPKPKPRPQSAPVMNFADLLKIAEKKQHEPIVIEQKPKEEEKLLTKKQKKEMEREREWRERKERGMAPVSAMPPIPKNKPTASSMNIPQKPSKVEDAAKKIPKMISKGPTDLKNTARGTLNESKRPVPNGSILNKALTMPNTNGASSSKQMDASRVFKKPQDVSFKQKDGKMRIEDKSRTLPTKEIVQKQQRPDSAKDHRARQGPPADSRPKQFPPADSRPKQFPPADLKPKQFQPVGLKPKQFPPADLKPKQFPPADLKPKRFPPADLKPKRFPPEDVRRGPPKDVRKKGLPVSAKRRRILDDDDDEYDSDLDDFIDDDDAEGDYSSYIKEIFGYDRSKYRDADDDVENMESTFAQQMREEVISTKIGIMEDLEDIKKEEEEKKKKALRKKRKF